VDKYPKDSLPSVDNGWPAHKLRRCRLALNPGGSSAHYGFTVRTISDKPGQFIGKVYNGSLAEYAGLREGDRLIELNGINVEKDFHLELTEKFNCGIQGGNGFIELLVVDGGVDLCFDERHALFSSSTNHLVERLSGGTSHKTKGLYKCTYNK